MPSTPRRTRTANPSSPTAARNGKANFQPYFQLQAFSPRTVSWQAGKGSFWTEEEARGSARKGTKYRVCRVAPEGRTVGEPFTA